MNSPVRAESAVCAKLGPPFRNPAIGLWHRVKTEIALVVVSSRTDQVFIVQWSVGDQLARAPSAPWSVERAGIVHGKGDIQPFAAVNNPEPLHHMQLRCVRRAVAVHERS